MSNSTNTISQENEAANSEQEDLEFATVFREHIRAGYQIMYVPTTEETRVETEIRRVAKKLNTKPTVVTWDCFAGFDHEKLSGDPKMRNPLIALEAIIDEKILPMPNGKNDATGNYIFVFRDLDDYMADPGVRRRLRSLSEGHMLVNNKMRRPLVIVSPSLNIHPKLRSSITVIDFALPDEAKLVRQVEFLQRSIIDSTPRSERSAATGQNPSDITDELKQQLAVNLLGLTSIESENCLSRCLVRHSGFKPEMLATIKEEKAAIVKKSEVLTYIPESGVRARSEIGGYDLYMNWLDKRKQAYTPKAVAQHIDFPKGVVLLGLPGTGKSMVAKATCEILGLPGYILDIGSLFGSMVGESEQRTRDVLKQIDAQRGCVLVIDEADKALGNAHNSSGDSGVTKRVFGTILTWLAENNSRTFCIMTLNRTEGLPPELTRAGRFDAMFYTDLPTEVERKQILEIHMRRRNVEPDSLNMQAGDWAELVKATQGFVGAELEEVVREARYTAFNNREDGNPSFPELMEAVGSIVPMTTRDPDGMNSIREFCKDKAKPVTSPQTVRASQRMRGVDLKQ